MPAEHELEGLRARIRQAYTRPEAEAVAALRAGLADYGPQQAAARAEGLIETIRGRRSGADLFQGFLQEYGLNSAEGLQLMGLAEALLRIPDPATQNRFLQDKLAGGDWFRHLGHSESWLINLASGALAVGGGIERLVRRADADLFGALLERLGEPLIRNAVSQAMRILAEQFVIAEDLGKALERARRCPQYRYSFDMLGEAALTAEDAERYYAAYAAAIAGLADTADGRLFENPGISVKLSALYPRYEVLQQRHAVAAIGEKLLCLAKQAKVANINLTVDAEEAERLEMSLDIFAAVFADPTLADWPGLGLAVQAYQKRALTVIDWLAALAQSGGRRIPIRLVKGAYWDSEIKRAQEQGWESYPVFTRKAATDLSYLACAQAILARPDCFYGQFATHNAHSVLAIQAMAGPGHAGYEFQRLHGMGQALYDTLLESGESELVCRVYAPVGAHRELLPYLVRRLLENGANSSFVNQIENPQIAAGQLAQDPAEQLAAAAHAELAPPPELFSPQRRNSAGINLSDPAVLRHLRRELDEYAGKFWQASPLVDGKRLRGEGRTVYSPYDRGAAVGQVLASGEAEIDVALQAAERACAAWCQQPVVKRAACLQTAADLFERNRSELLALCIREGGRTLSDALAELREAVDLCRYYAANALALFGRPQALPGPTGEDNRLGYRGRGVFVCISPWNFPLAIFVGQIAAALLAGNSVIAKPAEQTALTAMVAVRLLHRAGVPKPALQLLPGDGARIGQRLLSDPRVAGVAFTGSVETASLINRQLSLRSGSIATLIAETGGLNAMLADSSAHTEQLVRDALQSAFNSAGQRCSALRVLFLPEETCDAVIERLIGAMRLLRLGSPCDFETDVGPIIDDAALAALHAHLQRMAQVGRVLFQTPLPPVCAAGSFFPPSLVRIPGLQVLDGEVFGPILHVVSYRAGELAQVVEAINATGYGLTLGLHTRLESTMQYVANHARVGNLYVNRNMIGAVVGVQPFGGMGLSGTGPKAGGPNYLSRFAVEQTVSINTAAIGGNPALLQSLG
ncbi:bifunctional proline dehydrogenase/L-glutamate gamma-semialdehyde dehydrogenase PutA [Methylomonas sp. SURF-1]|uniref:Bifunctional protein PutA n=1 Tax=Methylomonas aurea TaxID=2952224 RepID=A0ABT1UM63_9GAMM|nr:bifunctional proline dehydrogenase/L-glutamate gamma-semialdehyde dehydrogenase PutA [Methylomonas sp. SURF-1]MCQ8183315.1 bifunctional proline dehydrogenase/L-glutamate gamma-semialdehyde dehydrogenase PutA [Methylomonas sp. SURF-1]